jgi:hypothetical protein
MRFAWPRPSLSASHVLSRPVVATLCCSPPALLTNPYILTKRLAGYRLFSLSLDINRITYAMQKVANRNVGAAEKGP